MIRGAVHDPELTLDNHQIARRHVLADLLQRYHRDRIYDIPPHEQPQLFEVLGEATAFLDPAYPINRDDFANWLHEHEEALQDELDDWLPHEIPAIHRDALLQNVSAHALEDIDHALRDLQSNGNNEDTNAT